MGSFQNGPCYKGAVLYWGGLEREPDLENYPYGSPRRSVFLGDIAENLQLVSDLWEEVCKASLVLRVKGGLGFRV